METFTALKLTDFKVVDKNNRISNCGRYRLQVEKNRLYYPCEDRGGWFSYMVDVSYQYSHSWQDALDKMNVVLRDRHQRRAIIKD